MYGINIDFDIYRTLKNQLNFFKNATEGRELKANEITIEVGTEQYYAIIEKATKWYEKIKELEKKIERYNGNG